MHLCLFLTVVLNSNAILSLIIDIKVTICGCEFGGLVNKKKR